MKPVPVTPHMPSGSGLLSDLRQDRITVLISHHLASVVTCARIYVFDNGRFAETETHDELMAQVGGYASMFTVQAAGYQPASDIDDEGVSP